MKYIFFFCNTTEDQAIWETLPKDAQNQEFVRIREWYVENNTKIKSSYELQSPSTATTIRFRGEFGNGREPEITDGPFVEGNEVIGGYALVEVENLDEALRMAKAWPGGTVEIRPVFDH